MKSEGVKNLSKVCVCSILSTPPGYCHTHKLVARQVDAENDFPPTLCQRKKGT